MMEIHNINKVSSTSVSCHSKESNLSCCIGNDSEPFVVPGYICVQEFRYSSSDGKIDVETPLENKDS